MGGPGKDPSAQKSRHPGGKRDPDRDPAEGILECDAVFQINREKEEDLLLSVRAKAQKRICEDPANHRRDFGEAEEPKAEKTPPTLPGIQQTGGEGGVAFMREDLTPLRRRLILILISRQTMSKVFDQTFFK